MASPDLRTRLAPGLPHVGRAPAGRHGPPGDPLGHRGDAPQGPPGHVVRRGAARPGRRHGRHDVRRRRGRARRLPDRGRPGGVRLRLPRRRRHHPPRCRLQPGASSCPEGKDRKLDDSEEGCLSYPGAFVDCARPDHARVIGQGLDGRGRRPTRAAGCSPAASSTRPTTPYGTVFGDRLNNRARKKLRKQMEDAAEDYPGQWPVGPATAAEPAARRTTVRRGATRSSRRRRALTRRRRLQVGVRGQLHRHGRADPHLALDRDGAVLLAHQLAHAGEAEPGAAVVLGHPAADELVEDDADVGGVDPAALVGAPTSLGIPPVPRLKVMSTGESGGEYFSALTTRLVTTRCIATPLARGEGDVVGDVHARGVEVGGEVVRPHCAPPGTGRCRPAAARPARRAGVANSTSPSTMPSRRSALDSTLSIRCGPGLVVGVADRVDEALDGGDRRAEVVVEGGVERVLGVLERLDVGAVAGDLGVAGEVAVVVVEGGDDDVAPEAGAVLADPPAGVLDPPGLARRRSAGRAAGRGGGPPRCRTSRSCARSASSAV